MQCSFILRGPNHFAGGYDHGIQCLRGVPIEMFRMIAELSYFFSTHGIGDGEEDSYSASTGDTEGMGEIIVGSEQFNGVVKELLMNFKPRLAIIEQAMAEVRKHGGPVNEKERVAKIYTDGQVEIWRCVISELQEYLDKKDQEDSK